jgi:hypothetical protein
MDQEELNRQVRKVTVQLNLPTALELDAWCAAYAMDQGLSKQTVVEEALREYRRRHDP